MKKIMFCIGLFLTSLISNSQTPIYSEDFTGQVGQGAVGSNSNPPVIDLSAVDWSVDISNATLSNNNDYLRVTNVFGNELLEGRDLNTEAIWLSPAIDISNFSDVEFSLEVSESNGTNGNNLEASDTVTIEYRLDGGSWIQAANNGSYSNDYDPTVTSQTSLNGNTLELRVIMVNNGGGERMRIDNIEVSGIQNCTTFTLPFNEDFEGGTFPPTCWNRFRGQNGLGATNDWTASTLVANSGTTSAFVEFEVVTGGNAQDWLVTPAIDLGTGQTQLRFFAREQFTTDFSTEYTVRLSQTSPTDINSFTTIQTYNEAQLGSTFNEKTIDLSAYTGVVYIAFVMEQNDGDNWFLDDVSVTDISSCSTPTDVSNLNAGYVDAAVDLSWALSDCYDEILVVAREGSPVTATPTGDGSNYIANANFGSGTEITSDEFIVFQGTANNVSVTNVIFGNTYHFGVFARKGTNWSAGVPISLEAGYCEVTGDTSFGTAITLVNFGTLNNVTGTGPGYNDFTSLSTTVNRGSTENLTVNLDTAGNFAVYCYAWIDWNQDGDFNDANETYDLGETVNNPNGPTTNSPLAITIPNDAILGPTRLRVLSQYYFTTIPSNGPCDGSTDGEIEDYSINVIPGVSYVYDNGWSPSNPNGVATSGDTITVINGEALINSNTNANTVVVNPGASLRVNSGVTLDILGSLLLESTSTTYSSLILDGTVNGTVHYDRHVNSAAGAGASTTNNDLISPPLSGQSFGAFRTENTNLPNGTIGGSPAFLFGPFDTSSGSYINYQPGDDTSILTLGIGYRTGSTDNSTFKFTGTPLSGNASTTVSVGGTSDWNLIGNPYPSYLNVQDFLNDITNTSLIDENAVGIYGYDGAANDGWTILNLANTTASSVITPGQGFFVLAEANGAIQFTSPMRRNGTGDDFILGRTESQPTFLKLRMSDGQHQYKTEIYFNEVASSLFDVGYDAVIWGENPAEFSLYSFATEDNQNRPLGLQSLNINALANTTIPLGVDTNGSAFLRFELIGNQLPQGTEVFLLDMANDSSTPLHSQNYEVSIGNNLNGSGRFYLSFVNNSLAIEENSFESLRIYTEQANKKIIIEGQLNKETRALVYDVQGRLVTKKQLNVSAVLNSINAELLISGVYIVILDNGEEQFTQKVILR